MFEKIGRLAEAAATQVGVSRRGFLGRLGQGALVAAGALGGLLSVAAPVQANGNLVTCCTRHHCKRPFPDCVFVMENCSYALKLCWWDCGGVRTSSPCGGG
jgi:hypothetical protein